MIPHSRLVHTQAISLPSSATFTRHYEERAWLEKDTPGHKLPVMLSRVYNCSCRFGGPFYSDCKRVIFDFEFS